MYNNYDDDKDDVGAIKLAAVWLLIVFLGLIVLSAVMRGEQPPYNYCVDHVYYTRACEASPFSVAAGAPGYAGQICSAHTYAWRGDDLFTYPIIDQDFHVPYQGQAYPRPPASAGPAALAVWDSCYIAHLPLGGGYPCNMSGPSGTLTYFKRTWSQLPAGPQKTAWGVLYHCTGATPTAVPPTPVPTGAPPCPTVTSSCPCLTPTAVPPTATRTSTAVPPTRVPATVTATPHIGPNQTPTPHIGPNLAMVCKTEWEWNPNDPPQRIPLTR